VLADGTGLHSASATFLAHSHQVRFALCERWSGLSWRGDWLLYAATEGTTIALDTTRPNHPTDLTTVVKRVGGRRDGDGKVDVRVRLAS
jgi:hypothetical protein